MKFSTDEIQSAQQLRALGLPWEPRTGQYVWDEAGLIEQPSPFQERVHVIFAPTHFVRRAGSIERLKETVCWLPTWREARDLLRAYGLSDLRLLAALVRTGAIEQGTELLVLYQLLAERLKEAPPRTIRHDPPAHAPPPRPRQA